MRGRDNLNGEMNTSLKLVVVTKAGEDNLTEPNGFPSQSNPGTA